MLTRNHYRTLANALMIIFIAFVVIDLAGQPIIQRVRAFYFTKRAVGRVDLLRADMTRGEVETTLGLSSHTGVTLGSGPPQYYMTRTDLGYGHHLGIARDATANPPRLISVNVDDKTWKPQDGLTNK
jgi:hypothetical protein